jgi:hypothetical protein
MSRWWSEKGQTAALRLAWWVHMACTLTLFVVGLLAQVRDGFWQLPAAYTTPAAPILVRMIPAVGPVYPFLLLMAYVQAVAFVTIGLFLFWRKADERIGILAS